MSLPYFAPSDQLPEPLPTEDTIRSGPDNHVFQAMFGRRVVRVGHHFLVKHGRNVSLDEGLNMLYVQGACDIVIPRVYALYTKPMPEGYEGVSKYIVMEYIPAESLETRWKRLGREEKSAVTQQLKLIFQKLRSVPSPGYIGSFGRRPVLHGWNPFWEQMVESARNELRPKVAQGPFTSRAEFYQAIIEQFDFLEEERYGKYMGKGGELKSCTPELIKLFAHDRYQNHSIVLNHGDFQAKNVLLRDNGTVVLIDWESAGWYPCYGDFARAIAGVYHDIGVDFAKCVNEVLEAYPEESIVHEHSLRLTHPVVWGDPKN